MGAADEQRRSDFSGDEEEKSTISIDRLQCASNGDGHVIPNQSFGARPRLPANESRTNCTQASRSARSTHNSSNIRSNPLLKYVACGSCSPVPNGGLVKSASSCT